MVLRYIKVSLSINLCSLETLHKRLELDSPPRMRLRIDENPAIPDIHHRPFDEVIHSQFIEILFGHQHFHSAKVRIEECRDLVGTLDAARLEEIVHLLQLHQSSEGSIQPLGS